MSGASPMHHLDVSGNVRITGNLTVSGVNISGNTIYASTQFVGDLSGENISGNTIYASTQFVGDLSGDNISGGIITATQFVGDLSGDNISGGIITATQFVGGTLTNCTFPSGIIIQVQHAFMTNEITNNHNWQSNQAMNSRMGIGDLQITITPKSSDSRLLLCAKIRYSQTHVVSWGFSQHFSTTAYAHKTLVLGSDSINSDNGWEPVAGSVDTSSLNNCLVTSYTGPISNTFMGSLSMDHMIDNVDTTERTYIPTFRSGWTPHGDANIVINNRGSGEMESTSTMTIYEIA